MSDEVAKPGGNAFDISPFTVETIAWLLMAAGVVFTAADITIGWWDHDGGFFLLQGARVAEGLRPYLDFKSIYPPLVDLITAFFVRLGTDRLLLTIALPFLWILANSFASALLAWRATANRGLAVLFACLFPLFSFQNGGNHLTLEHAVAFFATLAFVPLIGETPWTPRRVALAGLFASAAALSKQNGAVVILPIAAFFWTRRREVTPRVIGAFLAGALLLPLALLVWLKFDVVAIYRNLVTHLMTYAEHSAPVPGSWKHEFTRAPATAWLFTLTAVFAVLMARAKNARWIALAALAGGIIEFLPRLARNYTHYNLNIWPFIVVILACACAQKSPAWRSAFTGLLLLFASIAYMTINQAQSWGNPSPLFSSLAPAAQRISEVTPPDGIVRQYGAEPILEFLAERHEELIDKGPAALTNWDGSGVYKTPPAPSTTVVVHDLGQRWIAPLLADIRSRGFAEVGRFDRVYVFRNAAATR